MINMSSLNKPLKVLLLFLVVWFIYSEFFATHIKLINKTNYDIYSVKGEYLSKSTDVSSEEIDKQQRLVITPKSEEQYSIRFSAQTANHPIDISIGWDTRVYDNNGDRISMIDSQGSSFIFSEDGFCDYDIIIHEQYAEAKGSNKNFCYRRILLHYAKNIIVTEG
ncbi:hypothetical protein CXF65_08595 [Psychrobacter sp. Sarcosine-3u-12]|nr:hypothetical protein CXF65_08595 [Psychrobacter sp. Sarcosine-3u-12]